MFQVDLEKGVQRKLVRLIRVLLRTKKVYDKSKSRLRLDECGTYAGLVSKLSNEYAIYLRSQPSAEAWQQQQHVWFNQNLATDLLENFLLDESNVLACAENVWHIVALNNLSSQTHFLLGDETLLIRSRLKVCELLASFIFTYPNTVKLLARYSGWPTVLCHYLCRRRKKNTKIANATQQHQLLPHIIVSPSSTINSSSSITKAEEENDVEEEESWESVSGHENENEAMLSTPPPPPSTAQNNNRQKEFNKKLTRSKINRQVTSTLMKTSKENESNEHIANKRSLKFTAASSIEDNNEDSLVSDEVLIKKILNKEEQDDDDDDDDESELDISSNLDHESVKQLTEKFLYIVYRLTWDGIVGSSDEVWKERCQVLASLHRLGREYKLVIEIEAIELRILEQGVQRCCADVKKSGKFFFIHLV